MTHSSANTRYAIVTGGANGLGREFCLRLARDGWQVAVVDVDESGAAETLRLVEQSGSSGRMEIGDVTSIDVWRSLLDRLRSDWPQLDLLVNNAGMYASGFVGSLDLAEAERLIRLNLASVLYGCHIFTPWLMESAKSRPAAIINVASSFAFLCPPGMAPYNLSKAAVVALSETLHGELKPKGVGVTVVCPGPMPTRFIESASFNSDTFRQLTESYVRDSTLAPAAVAAAAIEASERRRLYVVLGTDQKWYWRIKRWLPTTLLDRVARKVRKDLARIQAATPGTKN
jgi:NAD(P)-dependent dehydrogenase (short-subunit alcohol dehydrogenase family)